MLTHISWQQYCAFILVAISLYYLVVWIFVLKMKLPSFNRLQQVLPVPSQKTNTPEVDTAVRHVADDLSGVFMPGITRPELLLALQLKLKKYNQWEEPGFRESITEYIAQTSVTKCSIHLSEEDQRVLWNAG